MQLTMGDKALEAMIFLAVRAAVNLGRAGFCKATMPALRICRSLQNRRRKEVREWLESERLKRCLSERCDA